jgi:3'-phosphoadenosine 5'-phosphosulfate sulfotransferase
VLDDILLHKFAEEAFYKHVLYGLLLGRKDTQPHLLAMIKKERFAETRKAKIRLSNIKIEELTQILRGKSKQIKH